ncbi:MAG: Ornithine decarboxylase [Piccolia ochrophora]|nr:MAG: Ornithine decarboxylase [Piccolia ochrophora]
MAPSAIDYSDTITETTSWTFPKTRAPVKLVAPRRESLNGAFKARHLISEALKRRVQSIDHDDCEPGDEDTFFVADMGEVYRQHLRWKMNLQRVKPFYAVKCNPDPQVLRLLAELGTGFDCASKQEVDQVLKMGVHPSRIIYANPCKTTSHVRFAAKQGVKQMTFDNADELNKIKEHHPDAELYLRILTDDSASLCRLSLKFGASLDATRGLLELAKDLDLNVVGVSFHVGSGATDPGSFRKAVRDARYVFDQAAEIGYNLHTLDVGGGFCSDTFESMAAALSGALEDYIPSHVRVIGEPGRYYVSRAFTIACNVIARRTMVDPATNETGYMVYLNDGLYGNFSSIMFDHQNPVPKILRAGDRYLYGQTSAPYSAAPTTQYSIWGPTCDGIDCINTGCTFSEVLDVGDWLYFEDMGAYTKCSATRFNGFTNNHDVVYISSEPGASALLNLEH